MQRYFYRGRGMPLQKNNIDTDQIMPAKFCYKPTRRGHENSVFGLWREDPDFVLNNPKYQRATILVAGNEFATGSSREFAVWGLKDWGFKAIIAPSFGDIFYKNAAINDLLPVIVDAASVEYLWAGLSNDFYQDIAIDLLTDTVSFSDFQCQLTIDDTTKKRYLENQDDIQQTLMVLDEIEHYEQKIVNQTKRIML